MMHRTILLIAGITVFHPLLWVSFAAAAPPNVVVFLADDAGWGDYGHSGNQLAETPQIDSIARQGVVLDRFFVCPVCAPTRAEFLTGRYHSRGGVRGVSSGQERLNSDENTVAEAFQHAGYATGAFGKWHNGSQWPWHPCARGFDEYFGHTSGHWGEYFDAPLENSRGEWVRSRGFIVDVCTDRALEFIERNAERPFFCYVPFTTPHSPWAVPEEYWNRFRNRPLTQFASVPKQEVPDETRCALAMLANQDWNVGRVLSRLDELHLSENTIVLYFSDNGPNSWRWNGGMKGRKGTTDEGGVRSVCFIRWPGQLPAGHRVSQIAGAIDLLPTLTSLAGIPRAGSRPLDGRDLTPLLKDAVVDWPDRMLFSLWNNAVSVRTQQFRYDHTGLLYEMNVDPQQTTAVNDQYPERAAQLAEAVRQWRTDVGAGPPKPASGGGTTSAPGRMRAGGAVDPRPIPVGYKEFPVTILPARDGQPEGDVKRSSNAPNCSYFVNWKSPDDRMIWLLDVQTSGTYEVTVDYTCPEADAGSEVQLSFLDSHLQFSVTQAWDPPLYTNQDTLPRPPAESQMKEFRTLKAGQMQLSQGTGTLQLQALRIPGQHVMDVRRVTLRLLQ